MWKPLPETVEALGELSRFGGDAVASALLRMSSEAQRIVPHCVGLSLGFVDDGLTFTAVTTHEQLAALDAVQYLDGGPCVTAAHTAQCIDFHRGDALDEERWALFARAGAAAGVASTLSLPILRNGQVTGTVNLYASTPDAFDGHHEELARVCGAWAPGAVTNADLAFHSRLAAAETPARLRDQNAVDEAIEALMHTQRLSFEAASERLREAADRAGISQVQAARAIVGALVA